MWPSNEQLHLLKIVEHDYEMMKPNLNKSYSLPSNT